MSDALTQELAKKEKTQSERFMDKVILEFGSSVGEVALTGFQKRLAQNYFIAISGGLATAEEKRLKKAEASRDKLSVGWANVNMEKLSRDVVAYARTGFDPSQKNHINMMPFKNNTLAKYDIVFIEGYRGIELKAIKYGLEVPDDVTVELVYSTDKFKAIKKDKDHPIEHYIFDITNEFDRGTILGGFYYHSFRDNPEKNKVVMMSVKDIEKRKPQYASVEFWGGEKDVWEKGVKTNKKETIEGWYDKMCYKTVYRAAYGDITIDSQKIDNDYMQLKQMESTLAEAEAREEIGENANGEIIDIEHSPANDDLQSENEEPGNKDEASPKSGPNF